ncbi:DUF2786 domain-containing protein [Cupriavidus gilardii]|uniref:DUF7168 domain-containing protein n=1 Tax=Cupriavidus gilardii TaxID=82541 RepID=UPI00352D09D8
MDRNSAIDKIKKCLALSASANEHEAAAALRQARALMEKFRISEGDILASDAHEAKATAGAASKPALWENNLAVTVCRAFGCQPLFRRGIGPGQWCFIGTAASPEIAQYAFSALMRQLKKARASYIHAHCKRLKPINKTRRADLFCQAWVGEVWRQVQDVAEDADNVAAIEAYMQSHHPGCGELAATDRNGDRKFAEKDWDAIEAGVRAGRQAQLHRGVTAEAGPMALPQ